MSTRSRQNTGLGQMSCRRCLPNITVAGWAPKQSDRGSSTHHDDSHSSQPGRAQVPVDPDALVCGQHDRQGVVHPPGLPLNDVVLRNDLHDP